MSVAVVAEKPSVARDLAPIGYQVMLGPVQLCSTTATSCSYTLGTSGTYTWKVTATNSYGSADHCAPIPGVSRTRNQVSSLISICTTR